MPTASMTANTTTKSLIGLPTLDFEPNKCISNIAATVNSVIAFSRGSFDHDWEADVGHADQSRHEESVTREDFSCSLELSHREESDHKAGDTDAIIISNA